MGYDDNRGDQCTVESSTALAQRKLPQAQPMGEPVNCTSSELSIYLLALEEGYLATSCLDTTPSALLKSNPIASKSYTRGSKTVSFRGFQSLKMSKSSTVSLGEERSMSCAAAFHAKTLASQDAGQELKELEADSGKKWHEWFAKFDRATSWWKIRQLWLFEGLDESLAIWPKWGTMLDGVCLELETPEGCTNEIESGLLHLPTIGKNEPKGSSRKRYRGSLDFRGVKMSEGLRTCESDPCYTTPACAEIMMNFPTGWTELKPLETHRMQQWLLSHGEHF
jgi:hypothetical protein